MRSAHPKVAHNLLGLPLAAWPIRAATAAGAESIVVVLGELGGSQERWIVGGSGNAPLRFALQGEPRGTGDAVAAAAAATEGLEHLFVLNGDLPLLRSETLRALMTEYEKSGGQMALVTCELAEGLHYGRVLRDSQENVVGIREARDARRDELKIREVNVGAYLVRRDLLFSTLSGLSSDNAQGEVYLTDVVGALAEAGKPVGAHMLTDADEMQGVNTRAELARAFASMRTRINGGWMEEGVTFEDPQTTWVGPDVDLGRDTVLEPGVVLRGDSRVGVGCLVGAHVVVTDSVLGDGAAVGPHSVLDSVTIAKGERVPPMTHRKGE